MWLDEHEKRFGEYYQRFSGRFPHYRYGRLNCDLTTSAFTVPFRVLTLN